MSSKFPFTLNAIREALKTFSFSEVKEIKTHFDTVYAEKEAEQKELEEKNQKYAEYLDKANKLAEEMGISVEQLANLAGLGIAVSEDNKVAQLLSANAPARQQRTPTGSVAAKFEYMANGKVMQWSGRGRLPLDLESMLLSGTKLQDLLISPTPKEIDKAKQRQFALYIQKGKDPRKLEAPVSDFKPVSDSATTAMTPEKQKEPVKPVAKAAKGMFAYEDSAGKLHTWNGKKTMPEALADLVRGGENLESFLTEETDENIAQAREIEHELLKD
ncbi:hypothetical protein ACVV7K_003800 [Cronobacter sakazakii]